MSAYRGSLAEARGRSSTKPREQYTSRDRIPQPAPFQRESCVAGSSFTTNGFTKPIAPSAKAPNSASFRVGDIVRVPHLVPALDSRETNPELRLYSAITGYICPKNRFAIVVGVYKDRMHVLPMYTCHGAGVSRKSEDYKLTAISVCHPRDVLSREQQSVLAKETVTTNSSAGYNWKLGSHVNVLDVVSVNYSWSIESGHGSLSDVSRTRLQMRMLIAQQMMRVPVERQHLFYQEKVKEAYAQEKSTLTVVRPQASRQTAVRSTRPTPSVGGSYATMASFH